MSGGYDPATYSPASDLAIIRNELREEFTAALNAKVDLLVTAGVGRHEKALLRIEASEKAAKLFEENLNRVPTQLDRETARLEHLFGEKLVAVHNRIDAFHAFASAMRQNAAESLAKSESSFTRDIASLETILDATKNGLEAKIGELTGRLDRGEGGYQGAVQTRVASSMNMGNVSTLIAAVLLGLGMVVASVIYVDHQGGTSPSGIVATVGADTGRVNDLISQRTQDNQQRIADQAAVMARMDALSARLNQLTPLPAPPKN